MTENEFSLLKQAYQPEKVNVLFIADGRPVNNRYFYAKNSNFYKAVKTAFVQVFGDFDTDDDFLKFFMEMGCYIDNLSNAPIKELPPPEQKAERQAGIQPLAGKIAAMQPRVIIISLKVIEPYAREAIRLSGADSMEHISVTPFPVKNLANVNNCINGIVSALKSVAW